MPVPSTFYTQKNIWVAAGDGDLERVKELIEVHSMSPNVPDPFTYTPMHAASSYGHIDVLEYLVSKGGNVNIADDDNETPLYTVESIDIARWLIDHGAKVDWKNIEDISPIEHLSEEFPEVAQYLSTRLSETQDGPEQPLLPTIHPTQPSNYATEQSADALTSRLITRVRDIMERAETNGADTDSELRKVVGETVLESMLEGFQLTEQSLEDTGRNIVENGRVRAAPNGISEEDDGVPKRSRKDEHPD